MIQIKMIMHKNIQLRAFKYFKDKMRMKVEYERLMSFFCLYPVRSFFQVICSVEAAFIDQFSRCFLIQSPFLLARLACLRTSYWTVFRCCHVFSLCLDLGFVEGLVGGGLFWSLWIVVSVLLHLGNRCWQSFWTWKS